jgi:pimeloyl-ACP methyl ester carboxylesterase
MQDPAAVRRLVLEEPPIVPLIMGAPVSPPRILRSLLRDPLTTLAVLRFGAGTLGPAGKLLKAGDTKGSIERFVRGCLGEEAFAALPKQGRAHMLANASTHVGQFSVDGGFEPITAAEIRSILTPTLVLAGEHSPPIFRRLCAVLAGLLPNGQRLDVPNASHLMHLENPDAVNASILRFLAG